MITSNFSVVEHIVTVDEQYVNYISDPEDYFTVTFRGSEICNIGGYAPEVLFGRLIMCWGEGINTLYVMLPPNKIIIINEDERELCEYLVDNYKLIRKIEDIDIVRDFALL